MPIKRKRAAGEFSAQSSVKKRARGKPFTSDNPYKFKSKKELGGALDPKINAGGKPKILSHAYLKYLAAKPPAEFVALLSKWGDAPETNAELLAARAMLDAASGNVNALKEIRAATEGEKMELTGAGGAELVIKVIYGNDSPAPDAAPEAD